MRENTKWIMLATAIAFVALMVFEWGMDATGRTSGGVGEIGRVNGTPVTYDQYQMAYRNLYDQVSSQQEAPITSAQNKDIEQMAWDEVVNQILIQQELGRRGIRVTDDEVMQAAQYQPPEPLLNDPLFQTDGQFDLTKYQDFLATSADQLFLLQLEAYYRDLIPRSKLLRQVTSGIYFTDAELWDQYKFENEQIRLRYVALNPSSRIPDAAVEVTDEEVAAYYEENEEDFQVPAQAGLKYVALTKAPLREDTLEARAHAEDLYQEIRDGADFAALAASESADETNASDGGDLGWFQRGTMVPAFDSLAFNAPVNRVQEPIRTSFGYHVMEVTARQGDSAQARHILIPIERTNDSEVQLLTLADSLEVLGESMTLDEAARQLGIPVRESNISEIFPFLAGVGQIADGLDWVFEEASPGDVSPVFEDQQAFYMMELVSASPASTQTLEEARTTIQQGLRLQKKVERARAEAEELLQEARTEGSLEVLDGRDGLEVQEAGPEARTGFFPGMGVQSKAVGMAFGMEVGEIGGPVVDDNNVFLVQPLEKIPADSTAWEENVEMQRAQSVFSVRQQRLQQWVQAMRDASDIVDRREEVFAANNAAAQQAQGSGMFF